MDNSEQFGRTGRPQRKEIVDTTHDCIWRNEGVALPKLNADARLHQEACISVFPLLWAEAFLLEASFEVFESFNKYSFHCALIRSAAQLTIMSFQPDEFTKHARRRSRERRICERFLFKFQANVQQQQMHWDK
jgi:hypothetical protein